jgi:hypothetical protein
VHEICWCVGDYMGIELVGTRALLQFTVRFKKCIILSLALRRSAALDWEFITVYMQ